jgi:hypothetical protein
MTDLNLHKQGNETGQPAAGEHDVRLGVTPASAATSKAALRDELRQVSPVLARLADSPPQLSPQEWDKFAEDLSREINVSCPPRRRTLRDRFSASNNRVIRWLAFLVPTPR